MQRSRIILARAIAALLCAGGMSAASAAGQLDPGFGDQGDGTQTLGFDLVGTNSDRAGAIVPLPGGAFYLVGTVVQQNSQEGIGIARFRKNGVPDPDFNGETFAIGPLTARVNDAALQGDGKLLVAGDLAEVEDFDSAFVCRFDLDGVIDTTFGPADSVVPGCAIERDATAKAILVRADASIVLAGSALSDEMFLQALIGLTDLGLTDEGFAGGRAFPDLQQVGVSGEFRDVVEDADSRIVTAGRVDESEADADFLIARFAENGSPDSAFNGTGVSAYPFDLGGLEDIDVATSVTLADDGSIYVAGNVQNGNGPRFILGVLKLSADGIPSEDFGIEGSRVYEACGVDPTCSMRISAVTSRAGGGLVLAGTIGPVNAPAFERAFALAVDDAGEPDATFGDQLPGLEGFVKFQFSDAGTPLPSSVAAMALQGENLLLAGTASGLGEGGDDFAVARLGDGTGIFSDGFEDAP